MSKKRPIEVGEEIEALCNKCKSPTVHVIEVIKNDKITKVMCKSCMSSHRYRKPDSIDEPKTVKNKTTKKAAQPAKTKEHRKWSRMIAKVDAENPIEYTMSTNFTLHDVLNHDKFGLGVVMEVVDPSKISVIFKDRIRTLVQNR